MAKARIQAVMQMASTKTSAPVVPPSSGQAASASEAESILARQSAAVDTLARRAAEATKHMQRQEQAFRGGWNNEWGNGRGQWQDNQRQYGGNGQDGGRNKRPRPEPAVDDRAPLSRKQEKTNQFFAKVRESKLAKQQKRSGSGR